jgi:signal recognition particle-docking protein FtsY
MSLFSKIKSPFAGIFSSFKKIDEDVYEALEETMIGADVGVETTMFVVDMLRKRVKEEKAQDVEQVKSILKKIIADLIFDESEFTPDIILVVGVNGVGKTTTIGKLGARYKSNGKTVILGAADTFRAAAEEQLEIWARRIGCEIVRGAANSDPASVAFETVKKGENADVIIVDTAGRLHNKQSLMDELSKIKRVISREAPDKTIEVLLVLDGVTGQNGINQAKEFSKSVGVSGVVLTKLDGTAKGGVALSVKRVLDVPIRFIGIGEGIDDLTPFDAAEFAEAIVG